jgi:RNA polymerase sigma-70 factor (ECF subfamily)
MSQAGWDPLRRAENANAGALSGRFRRSARIDDHEAVNRMVARAVIRARAGDRHALRYLYLHYADNVYSYVSTIVDDDHEAEDVTQHLFVKLVSILPKYKERTVPFSAWILRVAHNLAVDHMRRRRAIPCEEVWPTGVCDEDDALRCRSIMLHDALAALPKDQRTVLVLRHVVGLTPGEIADRMGKTEPSIHGLHHRGRGALRSALVEQESQPTVRPKVAA